MTRFLRWLDRYHVLWLLLAAPLMLFPTPKRTPALLVVPALWLLHCTQHSAISRQQSAVSNQPSAISNPKSKIQNPKSPIPLTPLNSALLLLTLMVLVSEWATFDLRFSLPKIAGMVLGLGVFFAVVREGERLRGWIGALVAFLVAGVGVAGLGLLGTRWFNNKFPALNTLTGRIPRLIQGLQGAESGFHPNEVAGALTWVLPPLLALSVWVLRHGSAQALSPRARGAFRKRGALNLWGLRLVLWPATLFVAGVFVLTQSRGAYIGLSVTLLVMLALALPRRGRWGLLALLLVAALVTAGVLSRVGLEPVRAWLEQSGAISPNAVSLNSLEARLEIWSRAIYGIQDFPFTGMGMNAFRKVVPVLYPLFLIGPEVDIGHAHNEFLQAALDLGIPGLIAFLALYLTAFWLLQDTWAACNLQPATSNLQPAPSPQTANPPSQTAHPASLTFLRYVTLGLFGGLLAHLLYGLTDAIALGAKPGFLFWMLLGLIVGWHRLICGFPQGSPAYEQPGSSQ